ncbi:hypothetical protein M9Y10_045276 [Tritrichomonas musculus]|uniref:Anaphase-promoting complex subunit 4 WD40 domain-containing protein n=1 Tax=Tritrichomonas musculus TaxID=1915356 RepID=A0ABR2JUS9_9EUKA
MRKFSNYDFLEIHDQIVNCVDWIGENIYSGCLSGDVIELTKDQKSSKYYTSRTTPIHNLVVTDIYSSRDGSKIITSSLDGKCFVTERSTMQQIREIECPEALSPHCAINKDGTFVAVAGQGGHLYFDDLSRTTNVPIEGPDAKEAFFKAVRFFGSDDSKVVCLSRHTLFEVDVETQKVVNSLSGSTAKKVGELKRSNNCLATNDRIIALGTVKGYIQLLDLKAPPNEKIREIKVGGELIEKIEFSHDGQTLAIASSNKRVSLLDMMMLEHPFIEQQRSRIISISFNSDSSQIVSASEDKTVIIANIVQDEKS